MKLQPFVETQEPEYPKRSARWSKMFAQARRFGAVISSAALLSLGACSLSSPAISDAGPGGEDSDVVEADGDSPADADTVFDSDIESRVFELCEPISRTIGDAPAPEYHFRCGLDLPEDVLTENFPVWLFGQTCGEEKAWIHVYLSEASEVSVNFPNGVYRNLRAELIDPGGTIITELDSNRSCVNFHAEEGLWSIAISQIDPESESYGFDIEFGHPFPSE